MRTRNLSTIALGALISSQTLAATGTPYCAADLTGDNTLDFFDLSAFIVLYQNNDDQADLDESGSLDFFDLSLFLQAFAACPDLTDSDGDRIPDFAETDNGLFIDASATGTDPFNADTDGDGLSDGDEILGTVDGLILPGADPVRKDIFVECDWFEGVFQGRTENYRPTPAVEARVQLAFANASTPNPYGGAPGINIHLDYGQGDGHTGGNQLPGSPDVVLFDSDFNMYKADHFDPDRKGYYHYAIFANRYGSSTNRSSGIAELNGDDFMVTLVEYNSTNNMAAAFTHEIGHNLGLRHGGFENRNYKINYNSVMNYRFTFSGVDTTGNTFGNGLLDYSRGTYNSIDETAVVEAAGVNGLPVDFNFSGSIETAPYARNLNCSSGTAPCGDNNEGACYDSTCNTLSDNDDWNSIRWDRLSISFDRSAAPIECDNWPGKHEN